MDGKILPTTDWDSCKIPQFETKLFCVHLYLSADKEMGSELKVILLILFHKLPLASASGED